MNFNQNINFVQQLLSFSIFSLKMTVSIVSPKPSASFFLVSDHSFVHHFSQQSRADLSVAQESVAMLLKISTKLALEKHLPAVPIFS